MIQIPPQQKGAISQLLCKAINLILNYTSLLLHRVLEYKDPKCTKLIFISYSNYLLMNMIKKILEIFIIKNKIYLKMYGA